MKNIGIFGVGNMGSALLHTLLKQRKSVMVFDSDKERYKNLDSATQIAKTPQELCKYADSIFFAVKPSDLFPLLDSLREEILDSLLISICAGVKIQQIQRHSSSDQKIIRVMPNTPLLVEAGATGLAYNNKVTESEKLFVLELFQGLGMVFELDEELLDAVTGLSGSGPAFVFLLIEALSDGGVRSGLPREKALKLAGQTVFGAAKLFLDSGLHPAVLKDQVSSPKGTTIEGIALLEERGFRSSIIEAVFRAYQRSKELSS